MKVKWAHKSKIDYVDTLSYWKDRNVSTLYPQKIDTAVLKLEKEIAANPYFLAKYNHKLNLYRRSFMRGRYYLYYSIDEFESIITIVHFTDTFVTIKT
ncbi:MAG: type II toxin-antitoxin system RelE/ParE family toxin [Bacteroidota bacterium]